MFTRAVFAWNICGPYRQACVGVVVYVWYVYNVDLQCTSWDSLIFMVYVWYVYTVDLQCTSLDSLIFMM